MYFKYHITSNQCTSMYFVSLSIRDSDSDYHIIMFNRSFLFNYLIILMNNKGTMKYN